jgi:PAS domain S-box-containing protein
MRTHESPEVEGPDLAHALFEEAADALFLLDPATDRLLNVNPVALRLCGFTRTEVMRTPASYLFRSELRGGREQLREAAAKTSVFHSRGGYLLRTNQDGVWIPVSLSVSRLHVRPRTLALITARDVREQREADRRLRSLEGELAQLTASIAACLWSAEIDSGGHWQYRYFSPVVERLTGRPPDYFQAGPTRWESIVHPEDRPAWAAALRRYQGGQSGQEEYRLVWPDSAVRWVREAVTAGRRGDSGPLRLDAVVADVTDRRTAEEAAREQRAVLEQVLRHIPCAVFWKDSRSVYLGCNDQSARDVGLASPEEAVGKTDRDMPMTPEEADFYVRCDREVIESGRPLLNIEETQRRPDGQVATLLTNKVPLRDAAGRIVGVLGAYADITARKRAEEALAQSEGLFRGLVEQALVGIYILQDDRLVYFNPRFCEIFGFSQAELLALPCWLDLVAEDDRAAVGGRLAGALDAVRSAFRGRRKDGARIDLEAEGTRTEYHGRPALVGTLLDVTEHRRREEELRRREGQLAEAQRIAHIGSFEWDPASGLTAWTDELYRIYGVVPQELPPAEVFARHCPAEEQAQVAAVVKQSLADGRPFEYQHRILRPDGTQGVVRGRGGVLDDPAGKGVRLVGTIEDITERVALEEQLRQAQKMEAVGRLAGGVAHDFNNLLTVINGYGDLVIGLLPEDHPARDPVAQILRAGERAAALTRQLLAFSRQQLLTLRLLDLNAVVADLDKMLRRLIGEDVELVCLTDPRLGPVKADPGQIEQVLLNLVVNARDAMPTGGRLTIETRRVELDEAYARTHPDARPGPHALVRVTDTGTGMDAATLARIWEPFYTTKGAGKGTGLGLAMVYGIVKQSEGHVAVTSEPGRGSTFRIYLPQAADAGRSAKSNPGAAGVPRGSETVLLAEDEQPVRALTRRVLQGCGYTLLEAGDGVEALQVAAAHDGRIDLLLSDVVMPRMGGRELAERLKALHPVARVLFLSGYTDDAVVRHGVQEDQVAFLQKPFTPARLALKVREVLDSPSPAGLPGP